MSFDEILIQSYPPSGTIGNGQVTILRLLDLLEDQFSALGGS
jgi:hypothetical protein